LSDFQLAQINIAHAVDDLDSAALSGFVARLDEINALADHSNGFVWRLIADESDYGYVQADENPRLIVNMSVWDDIGSLKNYVYHTAHVELIKLRKQWFQPLDQAHQALWWVAHGHQPTAEEGFERLESLRANGRLVMRSLLQDPMIHPLNVSMNKRGAD